MVEVSIPGLLSCDEERFFWLSWHGGHIVLGRGQDHGEDILIGYHDLDGPSVQALSISTLKDAGVWRFTMANFYGKEVLVLSCCPVLTLQRIAGGLMDLTLHTLTGGQIAAVVVGLFLIICLFFFAAIVIIRPPEQLQPYLSSSGENGANKEMEDVAKNTEDTGASDSAFTRSFENPMAEIDLAEQRE